MFCSECGATIGNNAAVCIKCGAAVAGNRMRDGNFVSVPNHMVGAVLTTLFCCQIGGIIAIIYASQVNSKLAMGDIPGAQESSKTAKNWIIANVCIGVLVGLISIIFSVLTAATA